MALCDDLIPVSIKKGGQEAAFFVALKLNLVRR